MVEIDVQQLYTVNVINSFNTIFPGYLLYLKKIVFINTPTMGREGHLIVNLALKMAAIMFLITTSNELLK